MKIYYYENPEDYKKYIIGQRVACYLCSAFFEIEECDMKKIHWIQSKIRKSIFRKRYLDIIYKFNWTCEKCHAKEHIMYHVDASTNKVTHE